MKYTQYAFSTPRGCQIKGVSEQVAEDTLFHATEPVSTKYGLGCGKSNACSFLNPLTDGVGGCLIPAPDRRAEKESFEPGLCGSISSCSNRGWEPAKMIKVSTSWTPTQSGVKKWLSIPSHTNCIFSSWHHVQVGSRARHKWTVDSAAPILNLL